MPQLRIDRFHGGMTDLYVGAEPHFAHKCVNLLIDRNGKPYQRDGRGVFTVGALGDEYDLPGAGGQSVQGIFFGLNTPPSTTDSTHRVFFFAFQSRELHYIQLSRSGAEVELSSSNSWSTATVAGYTTTWPIGTPSHIQYFQRGDDHIYIVIGRGTESNTVGKIFKTSSTTLSDIIKVSLPIAGIPSLTASSAAANDYLYQAFYERSYTTTSGRTYIDRGPVQTWEYTNVAEPSGGTPITFSFNNNGIRPAFPGQNYGINSSDVEIVIRVFRTINGGTDPLEVFPASGSTNSDGRLLVPNGSVSFSDQTSDSNLAGREQPYTSGGEVDNDPLLVGHTLATYTDNNTAFYSRQNNVVYHSKQSAPDHVPVTFFKTFKSNVQALDYLRNYCIVFERERCSRLEGAVDDLGRGTMQARIISEENGILSENAKVSTDRHVYFASMNGIYRTDGFRAEKLTSHLNDRYSILTQTMDQQQYIHAEYDKVGRRVYFYFNSEPQTDLFVARRIAWVIDLNYPVQNEQSTVTEHVYPLFGAGSTLPLHDAFLEGTQYQVDNAGYTYAFRDYLTSDILSSTAGTPDTWEDQAVSWTWQSAALHFGMESSRKWVTKCSLFFKKLTNTLNLQLSSINDDKQNDPRRMRSVSITEADEENPNGFFIFKRWFPCRTLRCMYKQLRISNDDPLDLYQSADETDLGAVTVYGADPSRKNIQRLVSMVSTPWPSDVLVDKNIYFEFDNYQEGFKITAYTTGSDTIRVYDPEDQIPDGSHQWVIRGRIKTDKFKLEAVNIEYTALGESIDASTGVS